METNVKIEQVTLQDGRRAERHSYFNDQGNEIVEIYVEEKSPLVLEKRIIKEPKRETIQTIQDGQVVQESKGVGVEPCSEDFVRKDEIARLVAEGIVAALKDIKTPTPTTTPTATTYDELKKEPVEKLSAQAILEQKVESKTGIGKKTWINVGLGILAASQGAFFLYYVFAM
jgi:hypothetical protein